MSTFTVPVESPNHLASHLRAQYTWKLRAYVGTIVLTVTPNPE
jgi:hypothetical protein